MKKAAIYARVSTPDQHLENQILDLRKLAAQRGIEVVHEYCDKGISGSKARRAGLDAMMADSRRGEFSVAAVQLSNFHRNGFAIFGQCLLNVLWQIDSKIREAAGRVEGSVCFSSVW